MSEIAHCRACNRPIIFASDPSGRLIPLDAGPPVYVLLDGDKCERARGYYVSHFATCSDPSRFSSEKEKDDGGQLRLVPR